MPGPGNSSGTSQSGARATAPSDPLLPVTTPRPSAISAAKRTSSTSGAGGASAVRYRIITPPNVVGRATPNTSPHLSPSLAAARVLPGSGGGMSPLSPIGPAGFGTFADLPLPPPPPQFGSGGAASRVAQRTTSSKLAHPTPKTVLLPDSDDGETSGDDADDEDFGPGTPTRTDASVNPADVPLPAGSRTASPERVPAEDDTQQHVRNDTCSTPGEPVTWGDTGNQPPLTESANTLRRQRSFQQQQHHRTHIQELSSERARTVAENLPKEDRRWKPRCAAYATANKYRFADLINFLVTKHKVQVRAYDECLYAIYPQFCHAPLYATPLPPATPTPASPAVGPPQSTTPTDLRRAKSLSQSHLVDLPTTTIPAPTAIDSVDHLAYAPMAVPPPPPTRPVAPGSELYDGPVTVDNLFSGAAASSSSATAATTPDPPILPYGEVCLFEYGVVVCWGMTEKEERWLLRQLRPFHEDRDGTSPSDDALLDPADLDDIVQEEFHVQYETRRHGKARLFNDIITLTNGNHMTKVTISHGIAQSCKLLQFEVLMETTLERTRGIPKSLAQTGMVHLSSHEITMLMGQLYRLRMDVNLVSNVLDTPDFFWTEPRWQPLYRAVQKYLEITQRASTLNLRASVLSDLLDMLSSHTTSSKMDYLTYVIIILIAVDVVVLLGEIVMKAIKIGI
ncbi:hypothetical protein AMAG_06068 [Allomyces macrogynus ATCC 38327]|uniref:DUF155 domain-containing protein n=1 Tax=Allomyces macrogynus (strain ATCC 38327) TaxID=578462 RepID=A0A0L0SDZ7_ALLM3|nr:hypothetical protein AMAG_06068 [Allomyces macrogynus ATCC 38327]|eukprot:KNE60706.1 hypothetical protein AMAG_06068 [Allomyces macrogynus ATCC 38327]